MRVYVEAYNHEGQRILGNLDGQGIIHAKDYRRTEYYKSLKSRPKEHLSLDGRVVEYRIVTPVGSVLEVIRKD